MSSNKNSTKTNMNGNSKPGVSAISDSRNNRRSSRIQNTKDSSKNDTSQTYTNKKSSKVHTKQYDVEEKCSENNKNSVKGELEALFDQSDEEDSFESMFGSKFEQQNTKSMNSLVSSRLTEHDSKKDVEHNISNTYIATSSSLQPEDVSKVLKILSQPNTLHDASDSKPKPSLKTYSNRRKSSQKNNIVESFGLPDTPIISERPLVNNVLDTEILDASEITILDIKCIDDPWDITNLNQDDFSHLEEIRVKSDPQKHFKIRHPSGNLEDIQNNDFIFTSTPQIKASRLPKSNASSVNRSSEKEVDIDVIKSNIRKLLREKSLETSPKKTPSNTSLKHSRNPSKVLIQNGNISLEDSEMEIFNTPSVSSKSNNATSVKTNSLLLSKLNKRQNIHQREELEVISERRRNLRSSGRRQESTPNNARKSSVCEESPKLSDNSPRTRLGSNKEDSMDEEVQNILSKPQSDMQENQTRNKKKIGSVEHRLGTKLKLDDAIITTPRRILRSNSSLDIPLDSLDRKSYKVNSVKKLSSREVKSSLGKRLRSLSQENISTYDKTDINQRKMRSSLNLSTINRNDGHTPRNNRDSSSKTKENLQGDGVPQLKVLLSPLKSSLISDRSPQGDNSRKDPNTIRKSLRSYKEPSEISVESHIDAEKLVSTENDPTSEKCISTESNAVAERFSPTPPVIAKEAPIENNSEFDLTSDQDAVMSKKIRTRIPQIFDDGSSSSESADIDHSHSPETLPVCSLPEKDVESDDNSLGLFSDNFSTEILDEFQQKELDILNNISEPRLQAEDDVNDAETTVEMASHSLPVEFETVSNALSKKTVIPDVLLEKDSSEQTNLLLSHDVEPDSSSESSRAEVGASEESTTTESMQATTEAHKDEADGLEHEEVSEKSEETKTIVPTEMIPEVPRTENQIVSVSQSEKELVISTKPIPEVITFNLDGPPSKCSSVAGIPEVEISSNKDTTDNTVFVLDKIEPTSVVDTIDENPESLELQEQNKSTALDEERVLSINETSDNLEEHSTAGKHLSVDASPEMLPLVNEDSEVTDTVVIKDHEESPPNISSLPETKDNEEDVNNEKDKSVDEVIKIALTNISSISTSPRKVSLPERKDNEEEVNDENDKSVDEVTETVLTDVSSISTSPVYRNLRKRKVIKKKRLKPFKIKKKDGSHKLKKQSSSYKLRKLARPRTSRVKTLHASSSRNIVASTPNKRIRRRISLENNPKCSSSVEAQEDGISSNKDLGDLKPDQQVKRKRGRPRKVISEKLPKEKTSGQINVGKRGRPRKVKKPKTLPKSQRPGMSREVAKLLECESTIVFNSNLVNIQKTCAKPVQLMGDPGSMYLQDKTTVGNRERVTAHLASSFNGASHSGPSQTQLFFEDVFDSQNTIADHVKKRSREVKSYKLSGTNRASGGCTKSNSFEIPLTPNSSLRSWKSLDFSENVVTEKFEFLESAKTGEGASKAAENEQVETPIAPIEPKANGDITTPVLLDECKRGLGRPRMNSLVKKQPKPDDRENRTQITVTAGPSSVLSNSEVTKKSILRSWLNQNLSCEDPELSDIEREMEKRVEKLNEPKSTNIESRSVEKSTPRSKTSLGARFRGEDTPKAKGRPRRKSLDQEASVTDEGEGNAKWKKTFSIISASRFTKKLRNADAEHLRDIKGDLLKFKVGSIAWAQIGSFPYWPCLITKELGTGLFVKNVVTKNIPRTMYHVRFFGDKGRRAWISKHKMMVYTSKEDLEKVYNEMKVSNKFWPETQYYYVKSIYQKKWICAVNEAQQMKSKNLKEKLLFFEEAPKISPKADENTSEDTNKLLESPVKKKTKMSKPDPASNIPEDVDANKSAETVVKRKSKTLKPVDAPSTSNEPDHDTKPSSRKPKKEAEQESKLPKPEIPVFNQEIDTEENKSDPFMPELSLGNEFQAPDQLSAKTSDDASEVESKASVDSLAIFSSHSLDAQKALFKRNTLFKGVSKEKVCQFCFKAEDVLKCRGGCNGVYHVRCAVKVLQEKVPRGRPRRLSNKTEAALEEKEVKEEPFEKEISESNGPAEKDKENNANLLDDDHVQIITVPSSVYNTPPRKTFPPNFANLTLAEQIDYKMKEIMRKFESKTTYSESAIEARGSEEIAGIQPLSRTRNFARSRALFPPAAQQKICAPQGGLDERLRILPQLLKSPNAVRYNAEPVKVVRHVTADSVRHVTADSTLDQTSSSEAEEPPERALAPPKSSEDDSKSSREMHVAANSPGDGEAKHVTADCETLEILQSENSNSNSSQLSKQSDTSEGPEGTNKYVNPKYFKCGFCTENVDPYCFVCHQSVSKKGSNIRQKCSLYQCSRFYHPECLKLWPQTQWSLIQTTKHRHSQEEIDSFVCPQHVCHTCASDDPRAATSRCSGDKIVKCQRCPSTYHSTNLCIPAGSDILSSTQIVCPRHRDKSKAYTINTTWCFLCSEGGNLICCETCPTSVHPECLPVNLTDDDKFICEDCESGRLPLYDEIVWVKLGKYRWWPGLVLFPNEIPPNVMNIKHSRGEFVVKFFGTYDHYWVNRGRSFLFQEGDAGDTAVTVKKKVEAAFNKAVEEAVVVHKLKKEFKLTLEAESLNSQKPPPYIKIKANKPVGNVRQMELDLSNTTACECDPSQAHPCGPDTDCLNRLLLTECNPEVCPAGKRCNNQCFEKREYPPMLPYKTQSRGWGLKSLAPIKKGQFVVEYVGEIIDDEEYQRRIQKMHVQKEENYYFLTIDKDRMIDAGPKGNVARFMNHCCQPNCETQKWTVNGDTRVGLFAAQDIPPETELTFNYNLECIGKEKKICRCGAPNCSGFIGVKAKQETEMKRPRKTYKKKEPVKPLALPPCFICGKRGNVGACNNKICNKAYHLKCLKMTEWPESNRFVCPWHNCKICSKRTIRCCVKCINSYCPSHSEGNVRYDNLLGFVCTSHDPTKSQNERVPVRKKRSNVITEESAVTSTTSDDLEEDDEDNLPLSHRSSRRKKTRKAVPADSESEEFCLENPPTSTPLRRAQHEPHRSQDETVSSATVSDLEDGVIAKRKRRRSRKIDRRSKRFRLSNVQNQSSTATAKDTNVNSKITRLEVDNR